VNSPSYACRRFGFGVACFIVGWAAAGLLEYYRAPVLVDVLVLIAALFAIAFGADRTGGGRRE